MRLDELTLTNFKNIADAHMQFAPKVNCLLGDNGMGKSNLLDAIYMLSLTRSFSRLPDKALVRRGETFMMLRGVYTRLGMREELTVGLREGSRKAFQRSGKEYRRITEHIGLFPLVLVSPADTDLSEGMPAERRRWLDMVISQSDAAYLDALVRYNGLLEQRNRMLREHMADPLLYAALDHALDEAAHIIYERRCRFVEQLLPHFLRYYAAIVEGSETPAIEYASALHQGRLADLLIESRQRDLALGYTSVGPQRDDLVFTVNELPLNRAGSQGQRKTFTIALRFAQFDFLALTTQMKPLLLLDDIFDKLDARRVERIMALVAGDAFGQIFVTDTNRDHLDSIVARHDGTHRLWRVSGGAFTPLS